MRKHFERVKNISAFRTTTHNDYYCCWYILDQKFSNQYRAKNYSSNPCFLLNKFYNSFYSMNERKNNSTQIQAKALSQKQKHLIK